MKQKYSEDYGRGAIRTPGFQYNSRKNGNYPFGGLLSNEVVPSICLKENGTITIPSPPEALSECGVTSGDVKYDKFKEVGKTAKVIIASKSQSGKKKKMVNSESNQQLKNETENNEKDKEFQWIKLMNSSYTTRVLQCKYGCGQYPVNGPIHTLISNPYHTDCIFA